MAAPDRRRTRCSQPYHLGRLRPPGSPAGCSPYGLAFLGGAFKLAARRVNLESYRPLIMIRIRIGQDR